MRINLTQITEYQENQCKLFSSYSVESSLSEYSKRNQFNKEKIIQDIYNGKKAEFLVYNFLISKGKKLNSPDLNIYNRHNKSYDCDLILDNTHISVKSHVVNDLYPISWLFQKNDYTLWSKKYNVFLALVVMNQESNYMYLKKISEVTFKEPIKESLKNTKLCVYEFDIA